MILKSGLSQSTQNLSVPRRDRLPATTRLAKSVQQPRSNSAAGRSAVRRKLVLQGGVVGRGTAAGAFLGLVGPPMALPSSTAALNFSVEGSEVRSEVDAVGFYEKTLQVLHCRSLSRRGLIQLRLDVCS